MQRTGGRKVLRIIILTTMPGGEAVVVAFNAETKFEIYSGAEGACTLVLSLAGVQRILHVQETSGEILKARDEALSQTG